MYMYISISCDISDILVDFNPEPALQAVFLVPFLSHKQFLVIWALLFFKGHQVES